MSVETLDNEEQRVVEKAVRDIHRHLDDGVECIGGIAVAAGLCRADRSDLRKAIDRGKGRNLSLEDAIAIAARVRRFNPSLATKIGAALVGPLDLLVFPRVTMTDEERANRCEAKLLAIGQQLGIGDQFVVDALGGRK